MQKMRQHNDNDQTHSNYRGSAQVLIITHFAGRGLRRPSGHFIRPLICRQIDNDPVVKKKTINNLKKPKEERKC